MGIREVGLSSFSRALVTIAAIVLASAAGARGDVTYARLRNAAATPGDWLTYSGTYASQRFSALDQIRAANVAGLRRAWTYTLNDPSTFEATPIVADGVMYVTEPSNRVTALDAKTGRVLWKWHRRTSKPIRFFGVNRGVAVLGRRVYMGTTDARLVAIDARSGKTVWSVPVGDADTGHSISAAPLALDGKVIVGVSGGDAGIRGFLDAYDARTGRRLWRFWTIPAPGQPGHETWGPGDAWKRGGAATWMTGSFDPDLGLLYWMTGNPAPDWNGDVRPGHNLYSCSILAIDADSGKLRWHFQFLPHDEHDWDANQIPVLFDARVGGLDRKLVATANRNGFYYLLDRVTGEFLLARAFAKQTWAERIDEKGRPVPGSNGVPTVSGAIIYPSLEGATNWFSPSFDPRTRTFFVSVWEGASVFYRESPVYRKGEPYSGGGAKAVEPRPPGAVRALDAMTGEQKWEFMIEKPGWGGLLATAGGIVFGGTLSGAFFALDDRSGALLWSEDTGGDVCASPITYEAGGRQYVAIAVRRALVVYAMP